ncbi:type I-E CRISPR-associated endoribonuclease Cas2e [Fluviispira multicolorata]|uniref:Type I-E CRISPR-associated endoribonuclease Cas2 n=1 Tax=Fluviispira multicolorata TaxID=2654512 RepID=A0A833JGX7_9BACT|nr:type I-E CRISPR-associated endoribonuclease Cas2e [Fluviispira multicolorata]KAB8032266.1 type I-E CRISPR-associated endoribonuclease Cas2 [Fluviispira multicolorata]
MVVIILECVPVSLRGELSKWLIEPKAGVFVGKISALVRENIWNKCQEEAKGGSGVLLYSMNNEQGYSLVSFGDARRQIVDFEGLSLIRFNEK